MGRGLGSLLVLLSILLTMPAAFAAGEDWNFTVDDYARLVKSGGKLTFASDSAWFPREFRENLVATLEYVLDPNLKPSSTDGVNLTDFYHGHIACDGSINGVRVMGDDTDSPFAKRGLKYYDTPTSKTLARYRAAVIGAEKNVGKKLRQMLSEGSCKNLVVVYHTYEYSGPRMSPGDSRRNLLTRLGASRPEHYTPPDTASASSWVKDFVGVFQFAFLVDKDGRIHVTISTTTQLQARVMNQKG